MADSRAYAPSGRSSATSHGKAACRVVLGAWHSEGSMVKVTPEDVELIHFLSSALQALFRKSPPGNRSAVFTLNHQVSFQPNHSKERACKSGVSPDLGNGYRHHRFDYRQLLRSGVYLPRLTHRAGDRGFTLILYFYAIYLLCTRPHDERFVQIYMLIMSILMLPWDWCWFSPFSPARLKPIISEFHQIPMRQKTPDHAYATVFLAGSSCYSLWPLKQCETHPQEF